MEANYIIELEFDIGDETYIVGVTEWDPYIPAVVSYRPEYSYPSEGGTSDWVLFDPEGGPVPELTDADRRRIDRMVFEALVD